MINDIEVVTLTKKTGSKTVSDKAEDVKILD